MKEELAFQKLFTVKESLWKSFNIKARYRYDGSERRTCFTTTDQTSKQHMLHFCAIEPQMDGTCTLSIEWIRLRADGSVMSNQTDVDPQFYEQYKFPGSPTVRGLRALAFKNRRIFLLWEFSTDNQRTLHGFVVDVAKNGVIPHPRVWKALEIKGMALLYDSWYGGSNTTSIVLPAEFALAD